MLQVDSVRFTYAPKGRTGFELGPVTFNMAEGESLALVGTSGCGKTTLLKLLSSSLRTKMGEIRYKEYNLATAKESVASRLRRTSIGMIHQNYSVLPFLTVEENVTLPSRLSGRSADSVREVLERFGMWELRDRTVSTLSGGQQQRVAISRAICQGADLLLCDEPTGALDAVTGEGVADALYSSLEMGVQGLVISTHDLRLASRADRVFVMDNGGIARILKDATPEEIYLALRSTNSSSS